MQCVWDTATDTNTENVIFVNSSNLTIMGMQRYFQYFDCFKYFLFFLSCETINAVSSEEQESGGNWQRW